MFDEQFVRNQDDELNLRLTRAGLRILLAPTLRIRYFVRGSLRQLSRQYFQYGYWKWRVFAKHGQFASIRHMVPSTFVLCVLAAAVLGLFSTPGKVALAVVLVPYFLLVTVEALRIRLSARAGFAGTAMALMTLHFSYGTGLLRAILDTMWHRARGRTGAPPTEMSR